MNTQQQINFLQTRQLELLAVMAASDDHASKCIKREISFREAYPDDYDAYQAANEEYNANEQLLAELQTELEAQMAEEAKNHHTEQWTGQQ